MKTARNRRSPARGAHGTAAQDALPLPGIEDWGQPGPSGTIKENPQVNTPTPIGDGAGTRGRSSSGQKAPTLSPSPPLDRGDGGGDRPRPNRHAPRPPITKQDQERDCDPHCLTCHQPDGEGHCTPHCATLCWHARRHHRADICITLTHAQAHIVISPNTGYMHLHVTECPHCGGHHAHAPLDHPRYRTAPCTRRPYVLDIQDPEGTA